MSKILVKQAVGVDYSLSGQPVMVLGGGRGGRGGQARGRTLRERAGGILGGTVGVLGALAGQHRSLGGLAQSMISGGAQGAGLGSALGRKTVGRVGQARADIREAGKQARAEEDARLAEATRSRGQGPMSGVNPMARIRRGRAEIQDKHQQELERVNRANLAREAAQQERQQVLVQQAQNKRQFEERARQAEQMAAAKARGTQFGTRQQEDAKAMAAFREQTGLDPSVAAGQFMGPLGTAISQRQGQAGGVDAAGNQVQVIGPGMHPNMLPAPSNFGDTAAGENKRMDDMGNQALVGQGTDTQRAQTVQPLQSQEDGVESPEQRAKILADMARGANTVQGQAPEPTPDEQRFNQQTNLRQF